MPGTEEYLDSEKYQIRPRDWNRPGHIKELIARVNQIRRVEPGAARRTTRCASTTPTTTPLICYTKVTPDPPAASWWSSTSTRRGTQQGFVRVPVGRDGPRGTCRRSTFATCLTDERFTWRNDWNFVRLDAGTRPAHILRIEG